MLVPGNTRIEDMNHSDHSMMYKICLVYARPEFISLSQWNR